MTTLVGIDAGGTSIRAACIDDQLNVLASANHSTPKRYDEFLSIAVDLVQEVAEARDFRAIGLALPGILNADRSGISRSLNLPFLEKKAIRNDLSDRLGANIVIHTDADAAAFGEFRARHSVSQTFVHLRFGTGVGLAWVRDACLQPVDREPDRHASWLIVPDMDVPCLCGQPGCLEAIASGTAVKRTLGSLGIDSLHEWGRLVVSNGSAKSVADVAARAILSVMESIQQNVGPTVFVLGGGLFTHADFLFADVLQLALERGIHAESVILGDLGGAIGCACLAGANIS